MPDLSNTTQIDGNKLNAFVGQMLTDLGGASSIAMVRMGDALGLYKNLHAKGPMTSQELADSAKVDGRYLREWLSNQASSNYLSYDPASAKFSLTPEQAMVFAIPDSPVYLMGGFDLMAAMLDNQPKVQAAFKSGGGVAWGDQAGCMFCAVARFFRPGYHNHLVSSWLPALAGGVKEKLESGARVADIGCGHGWSTVLMAKAFPKSQFVGYDFHPGSIADAQAHAKTHGVLANTRFEVGLAKDYPGKDFDLVTCFDCLHDMGDPAGAAAHIRKSLKEDGTWMICEPMAGDRLEQNINPVGRLYYAASTMICVPTSLSQEVGTALGAQAGEAKLREVILKGGFTRVRRATETPFNMILEAKPLGASVGDRRRQRESLPPVNVRALFRSNALLVDRMTDHSGEFAHQAIGHLPGHRQLALALEFRDRGLGVRAGGAGRLQLAIAVFGQHALHRRHAARAGQFRARRSRNRRGRPQHAGRRRRRCAGRLDQIAHGIGKPEFVRFFGRLWFSRPRFDNPRFGDVGVERTRTRQQVRGKRSRLRHHDNRAEHRRRMMSALQEQRVGEDGADGGKR